MSNNLARISDFVESAKLFWPTWYLVDLLCEDLGRQFENMIRSEIEAKKKDLFETVIGKINLLSKSECPECNADEAMGNHHECVYTTLDVKIVNYLLRALVDMNLGPMYSTEFFIYVSREYNIVSL